MHPTLSRPSSILGEPIATDIGLLESRPGFTAIRRRMLTTPSGSERLPLLVENEDDDDDEEGPDDEDGDDNPKVNATLSYTWERAGPYIAWYVAITVSKRWDLVT